MQKINKEHELCFDSNPDNIDVPKIDITINDLSGYAVPTYYGVGFHGKWASHTGYRNVSMDVVDIDSIRLAAQSLYNEQAILCYLVGDEHKEHGWKSLRINHRKQVEIRLPQWANQTIKDALLSIDMIESCKINHFWVFQQEVEIPLARQALLPLLQPNTRFADEIRLSRLLIEHYSTTGLYNAKTQLTLF